MPWCLLGQARGLNQSKRWGRSALREAKETAGDAGDLRFSGRNERSSAALLPHSFRGSTGPELPVPSTRAADTPLVGTTTSNLSCLEREAFEGAVVTPAYFRRRK